MVSTVLRLAGFDLRRQFALLKAHAEELKDHATDEIKRKAIDAGLIVALAMIGLVFVLITLVIGLIALYLWIAQDHGPFAALGVVASATAILAAILFIVAATRGNSSKPKVRPAVPPAQAAWSDAPRNSLGAAASPTQSFDAVTQELADRAAAAASDALNSTADMVRKSPREVILATLAVAVAAGVLIGRRR